MIQMTTFCLTVQGFAHKRGPKRKPHTHAGLGRFRALGFGGLGLGFGVWGLGWIGPEGKLFGTILCGNHRKTHIHQVKNKTVPFPPQLLLHQPSTIESTLLVERRTRLSGSELGQIRNKRDSSTWFAVLVSCRCPSTSVNERSLVLSRYCRKTRALRDRVEDNLCEASF